MQTLIRVGCCTRMRRVMPCRTFRGWHATRRVASIGQRDVQIQADGGRAAWRAETTQIVCAIFRPSTVSVSTRTLISGAKRNGRRAETQVEAAGKHRHLSLGRPAGRLTRSLPELRAAPGVGGLPSGSEGWQGGAPVPPALLAKGNQTGPVSSPVPVQGP